MKIQDIWERVSSRGKAGGKRQWLEKRLEIQTRFHLSKTACCADVYKPRFKSAVLCKAYLAVSLCISLSTRDTCPWKTCW